VKGVTTGHVTESQLGCIDTREIQRPRRLRFTQVQGERPRVEWSRVKHTFRDILAVHLRNHRVVEVLGHIFKQRGAVDVQRGIREFVARIPVVTRARRVTGHEMQSLGWVVKVRKVDAGISLVSELVLGLSDQHFMLTFCKILAFVSVQVGVHGIHLCRTGVEPVTTALNTNFNIVILHGDQWKRLSPVLAEEERNHELIGGARAILHVILNFSRRHGRRGLSLRFVIQNVVNTLDIQGVQLTDLLTTDVQHEIGRISIAREETGRVVTDGGNTRRFNPDVTQEITLGLYRDRNFGVCLKLTDVIDAFGFNRKVCVTLVVLTKETDFGLTTDIHILGTLGHEVNQGG